MSDWQHPQQAKRLRWPRCGCPESVSDLTHSDGLHRPSLQTIYSTVLLAGDGVLGQNQVHKPTTRRPGCLAKPFCVSPQPQQPQEALCTVVYISACGQSTQPQGSATLQEAGTYPGILEGLDNTAHPGKAFWSHNRTCSNLHYDMKTLWYSTANETSLEHHMVPAIESGLFCPGNNLDALGHAA